MIYFCHIDINILLILLLIKTFIFSFFPLGQLFVLKNSFKKYDVAIKFDFTMHFLNKKYFVQLLFLRVLKDNRQFRFIHVTFRIES